MNKFAGVNDRLIEKYKKDYINFIDNNFELYERIYISQIRLFNQYFTGVPENYVGSSVYLRNKKRFYYSLFNTYCYLRLYPAYEAKLNSRNIKMKIGKNLERLTTSRYIKKYHDARFSMFVKNSLALLDEEDVKDKSDNEIVKLLSFKLRNLSNKYSRDNNIVDEFEQEKSRVDLLEMHCLFTLNKLEKRSMRYKLFSEREN